MSSTAASTSWSPVGQPFTRGPFRPASRESCGALRRDVDQVTRRDADFVERMSERYEEYCKIYPAISLIQHREHRKEINV
jgi:hypothetical protein